MQEGKLFLIPTPIGNLKDITFRAVEILSEVDYILAEDTRHTKKLLDHLKINNRLVSHHQHNEHGTLPNLVLEFKEGKSLALVSDAGTPGISDPGFLLVRECIQNGIEVECLPGATAFVPAIVNSGFPTNEFVFIGFLPQKKGRQRKLDEAVSEKRTVVFYESPYRILKLLEGLEERIPEDRMISISRELTKVHEETVRGSAKELKEYFQTHTLKGEFVVVLSGDY